MLSDKIRPSQIEETEIYELWNWTAEKFQRGKGEQILRKSRVFYLNDTIQYTDGKSRKFP